MSSREPSQSSATDTKAKIAPNAMESRKTPIHSSGDFKVSSETCSSFLRAKMNKTANPKIKPALTAKTNRLKSTGDINETIRRSSTIAASFAARAEQNHVRQDFGSIFARRAVETKTAVLETSPPRKPTTKVPVFCPIILVRT